MNASGGAAFEALLVAALEALETDGERGLDAICAEHPGSAQSLREEIARLRAAGLVGTLPLCDAPPASIGPPRLGAYELLKQLGAGGMGEVWLAQQRQPIERKVALKVVRGGFASADARARFLLERQVLAALEHDGIARVFDAGATDDGVPYFAMEHIDGQPLAAYCDARALPLRARIELLCRVCDAIQHAHQHGVIHRDLKPGNVLVKEQDGEPTPKVIDFGLAKQLDPGSPELTRSGLILGTLEYMSPEQAAGDMRAVDTRSDVYGLGAMLYEQLTGARPLAAQPNAVYEFLRTLREHDPPRPSQRARDASLAAAQARGCATPQALSRALRGDLDWIALRALAKQPDARYASAAELAADLRAHLAQQPVRAHPPSLVYRARRFVARHRAASLLVAVGVVAAVTLLWRELSNLAELRARDARYDALALRPRLQQLREQAAVLLRADPGKAHDVAAVRAWQQAADQLLQQRGQLPRPSANDTTHDERELWLRQALADFDKELTQFTAPGFDIDKLARRVRWAEDVARVTLHEASAQWQEAIAAIADRALCPRYDGLRITPQLGLIPLRCNPSSGLWEFRWWHPDGEAPRFAADGRLENPATCDIVFVLLPGGTAQIGSDVDDPLAFDIEKPRHDVTLDPYFLGKYELSRGQWLRWTGQRPGAQSNAQTRHHSDDAHPIGNLSWRQASHELWEWGLRLPTEAQWEVAARAGTLTSWWSGAEPGSLQGKVNLADRSTFTGRVPTPWRHDEIDDGYPMTAPIDALAANGNGLHHVLGNLWEWCAGAYVGSYADSGGHRPGDGFLLPTEQRKDGDERVARGGSYLSTYNLTRCAQRVARPRDAGGPEAGARAARPLLDFQR